jgi:hypothetical protein
MAGEVPVTGPQARRRDEEPCLPFSHGASLGCSWAAEASEDQARSPLSYAGRMSARLLVCPGCSRHIRLTEERCPFCGAPCPDSFASVPAPEAPPRGLSRARLLRFGALAVAGVGGSVATIVGCSSSGMPPYGIPPDCNVCGDASGAPPDSALDSKADAAASDAGDGG